jgi:CheY-specific phosphatase CheX
MDQVNEFVKTALVEAISKTMENMAFEQVELIEDDRDIARLEESQNLPPEVAALLEEEGLADDETVQISLDPERNRSEEQNSLWTTIPINKPLRGELALVFDSGYARMLTESIYGDMEEIDMSAITILDAVAEIINTIAGRFIGGLISDDKGFELGLPNTGEGEPPVGDEAVMTLKFDLGSNILKAVVSGKDLLLFEKKSGKIKETAL